MATVKGFKVRYKEYVVKTFEVRADTIAEVKAMYSEEDIVDAVNKMDKLRHSDKVRQRMHMVLEANTNLNYEQLQELMQKLC